MNERLGTFVDALRQRSYWLVLTATAATLVLLAVWIGRDALARAAAWEARATTTGEAEALAATWRRDLEPPTDAEYRAWAESLEAVEQRGIGARDRVALMQGVAERAEALGIRDAVLNFVAADTLGGLVDRELEGSVFEPAPFALTFSGTMRTATLARLVEALPPQVELVGMDAVAIPEGIEARLLMLVFLGEGGGADGAR